MKIIDTAKLSASILVCCMVGFASSFFTRASVDTWYVTLQKPGFTPPGWVFGPAWTVLYILMATAAFLLWQKAEPGRTVRIALALYFVQLGLNALWTPLFFGLHLLFPALVEIVLLWLAIALTVLAFARIATLPALLLVPYLLWTTFATVLNAALWILNR